MNMKNSINNKYMLKKTSLLQKIVLVLFGLFLTIIILEIGLRIGGFAMLSLQEYKNLQSIKQKGTCRIMCLGESTTQNQYPPYLEKILNQRNIGIKFNVIDKGLVAIRTTAIVSQLEANLDNYQPDIIVTMMGCNDDKIMYYRDIPEANTEIFKHCRVYRFGRLIYMHILTKLKKEGIYRLNNLSSNIKTKSGSQGDKKDPRAKDFYQNNRELFEREQAFKKAIELNPNSDSVYVELDQLYRDQGRFAESEQLFKKAIELNPKNGSAYEGLGKLYRDQGRFAEVEQLFKKAIELNPNNGSAYEGLGRLYRVQGKLAESEQMFKKAIELNPKNDFAYVGLGKLYRDQGRFAESEQSFKKAIELNPKNGSAYEGLGKLYRDQGRFAEVEQLFKKAIELNPNSNSAYEGLGRFYIGQGRVAEVEQLFKKAIEFNPNNDYAYTELGRFYRDHGRFVESEQAYKKALELNPKNDLAYLILGQLYRDQGRSAESEQSFKKAMELNPKNERLYGCLAILYCEMGNNELSKVYAEKMNNLRGEYYNLITVNNYRMLKQTLDKRKIKLVCAQYPMRDIVSLKKIFKDDTKASIIFVDNERIFKDAVRKEGYKEYFKDMFAGDFGHCTNKGNRLLAENIANTILKEVFGK